MFVPHSPMQFVSLDIGYLPKDANGYQYILLIGDVFSKFINAIPLKDQTAPSVVDAFLKNGVYVHGTPSYLSTDQGSNVDGQLMAHICTSFGIEKRRSSAYHSQGNGFAERNIRTVKDILRSVLLHRHLNQTKWRQILPQMIFALNSSESKATQCIPFDVVFGRSAVLPQDILFDVTNPDECNSSSVINYKNVVSCALKDVFAHVIKTLELSKQKMPKQYNQGIRFTNYTVGQAVWLKVKHYKTGENRKLAPRHDGPWTILEKLPNGVNFKVVNSRNEEKVVHHDPLMPAVKNLSAENLPARRPVEHCPSPIESEPASESSKVASSESDENESLGDSSDESEISADVPARHYQRRNRALRNIPNTIPWNVIHI
eukprot:gene11536-biopygen9207